MNSSQDDEDLKRQVSLRSFDTVDQDAPGLNLQTNNPGSKENQQNTHVDLGPPSQHFESARLYSFLDAVFAIAATLLIAPTMDEAEAPSNTSSYNQTLTVCDQCPGDSLLPNDVVQIND